MTPQIASTLILMINIYIGVLIAWVIMSWLRNYNIANMRNPIIAKIDALLNQLVDPVIRPIQRIIPPMGGLDISPIFILLFLNVLSGYLRGFT